MNEHLNVFVISNSAISQDEHNGRVLLNILPDECNYMNFCIRGIQIDNGKYKYINISDNEAFKSVISFGIKKPLYDKHVMTNNENDIGQQVLKKTSFKYFLRNVVWNLFLNADKKIKKDFVSFHPSIIFLMAADSAFLYKEAYKLSKKYNVPLVIYSAEDYPLKTYDYVLGEDKKTLFGNINHKKLYKDSKQAYCHSSKAILNSKELANAYINEYKLDKNKVKVIHLPSSIKELETNDKNEKVILYAGNLVDSRCESLLDIANALKELNSDYKLRLFGKVYSKKYESLLCNNSYIEYKGTVPFTELSNEFRRCSLLLHVEGFDSYSRLDYKYAFSTKIADYLMLGKPFILYGPIDISGIKNMFDINNTFTITSKDALVNQLRKILSNPNIYYETYNKEQIFNMFSPSSIKSNVLNEFKSIIREKK